MIGEKSFFPELILKNQYLFIMESSIEKKDNPFQEEAPSEDALPEFSVENISLKASASRTEETLRRKQEKKQKQNCKCSSKKKQEEKKVEEGPAKIGENPKAPCLRCKEGIQRVKDPKMGGHICR